MDTSTTGLILAIGGVSGTIMGILATKGVDAWVKLRADRRIDDTREETSANQVLMFTIERQDKRIEKLESELRAVHLEHNDCERKYAALMARMDRTDTAILNLKKSADEHTPQPVQVVNTEPIPVTNEQK